MKPLVILFSAIIAFLTIGLIDSQIEISRLKKNVMTVWRYGAEYGYFYGQVEAMTNDWRVACVTTTTTNWVWKKSPWDGIACPPTYTNGNGYICVHTAEAAEVIKKQAR